MLARLPRLPLFGLCGAVLVHLLVLYSPEGTGSGWAPEGSDKVVHALIFGAPIVLGALVGLPLRLLVAVFAAHAVISEVVQHVWLPHRSGDPWDVVADLVGVLLGWLLARGLLRRRASMSRSQRQRW